VPQVVVDDFANVALWAGFDPVSAPSAEIVLASDPTQHGPLPDAASLRAQISAAANNHFLQRTLAAAVNLSALPELRFLFRSTRAADGGSTNPFRLRMQLGSAAMPIGAIGNTWHRYLPAAVPNTWQFVRLALDDLNATVRNALTVIRFTCVNTTTPITVWLDDLIGCRHDAIADIDASLLALLDGTFAIGGNPVPARVHVTGAAVPAMPWLRLIHHEAAYSDVRTTSRRPRTDFSDAGYRVRPEAVAYDLYYRIEGATTVRADEAAMLQFVMDTLGNRRTLLVNGVMLQVDRVKDQTPVDDLPTQLSLRYRVTTLQERGPHQHVLPVLETKLTTDHLP
jgi:hypothetical protein